MSRDDGFPAADLDVKFLRDPKVRRLRRLLSDPGEAAAAEHLYLAVVLSSWETGYRTPIDDAVGFEETTPERVAALKRELLDEEGKIPYAVWERWFRLAWERREKKRAGGRLGNERRWHADASPQTESESQWESLTDRESDPETESPSLPSVSSGSTGPSAPSLLPGEASSDYEGYTCIECRRPTSIHAKTCKYAYQNVAVYR